MKKTILLLLVALLTAACSKSISLDEEENTEKQTTGTLAVRAANVISAGGESEGSSEVSYPITVYVMNNSGSCVALQQINSSDEQLQMKLPTGLYDIYAVAGADADIYDLPSKNEATAESLIALKEGKTHGDLMTAQSNAVLSSNEVNKVTLAMRRNVMLVESVSIKDIPSDVSAVSVTLSPLYENIRLDGEYTESVTSYTFSLTEQADGTTWTNDEGTYLLGATKAVTVKVSLTSNGETTSYSYKSNQKLASNYKVNITGTYTGNDGIEMSGTITGALWEGEIDIDFEFDEDNISSPGDEDNPQEEIGEAPAVGTLYKGCYVLRSQTSASSTIVTLMTPQEMNKLTFSQSKDETKFQTGLKETIEEALPQLEVEGIDGWRLPNIEELEYIQANIETINSSIHELQNADPDIDLDDITLKVSGGNECGYYYLADDGMIYVMKIVSGMIVQKPNSGLASYKLRGFATVSFSD